jgi:hypothetical protein
MGLVKVNSPAAFTMDSPEERQKQVKKDYENSKMHRADHVEKWLELQRYYDNDHYATAELKQWLAEKGYSFIPPSLTDAFIQVESQIDPSIPQFEFRGKDGDIDPERAKIREAVTQYIVYNNNLESLNIENERHYNKLGNAWFKVGWDGKKITPLGIGEIIIGNPMNSNMFPDPAAYDVDDCEFLIYSYRTHRRKARRKWGEIIDEIGDDNNHQDTEIFAKDNYFDDETLQVVEYWYRDLEGDIACSIQINFHEVQHIEKYWDKTRASGNQMFPFVKYCKTPVEQSFWDKGEIETIKDLLDAMDREFLTAILNDMFGVDDVIIYEEGALCKGEEIQNTPGHMIKAANGRKDDIKRLGGIATNIKHFDMLEFLHEKILETNGNYGVKGSENVKVTTASGLAQIREDRDSRATIKKADRKEGFRRLYQLIDWTAMEFYNMDRVIYLNGKTEEDDPTQFMFNSSQMMVLDDTRTPMGADPYYYFPAIDVQIIAGDGVEHSKSFTIMATENLMKTPITPVNVGIVKAYIDLLDLPNKKELKNSLDMALQQQQMMEQQQMMMQQQGQMMQQGGPGQQLPPGEGSASPEEEALSGQVAEVMHEAGLNPEEAQTFLTLLAAQPPEQQQEFLNASMEEQLALITELLKQGEAA